MSVRRLMVRGFIDVKRGRGAGTGWEAEISNLNGDTRDTFGHQSCRSSLRTALLPHFTELSAGE